MLSSFLSPQHIHSADFLCKGRLKTTKENVTGIDISFINKLTSYLSYTGLRPHNPVISYK